jgi:hypothetical protein
MTDQDKRDIAVMIVDEMDRRRKALIAVPGPDFTPEDIMEMTRCSKDTAYHPRLVGRYQLGRSIKVNREDFLFARQAGQNLLTDR